MNHATLLIGGNQGDRILLIDQATEQIRQRIGSVVALSTVYETEPWGEFDVPPQKFLNRGMVVATTLIRRYHSRPMDIDLIFYDNLVVDTPELTLPHPRMHLRHFVLEPLAEIMPEFRHPVLKRTITQLLHEI